MSDVLITCIKNGRTDSVGNPLLSGVDYTVEINLAKSLWQSGFASVNDTSVFVDDPFAGTSPLEDYNVARSLLVSSNPAETAAIVASEMALVGTTSGGGGLFSVSGSVTYAGGNVTVTFPNALSGATLTLTPTVGEIGVDYSGDDGTTWISVYGGNVSVATTITINAIATNIRLRPIASGATAGYAVSATGAHVSWSGSITYSGGNVIVDLDQAVSSLTAYIFPSVGAIGVDYTGDSAPGSGSNWIAAAGGDIGENDSIHFSAAVTGIRFRPIATGAAADYLVRV